jgi:hypothetical protein
MVTCGFCKKKLPEGAECSSPNEAKDCSNSNKGLGFSELLNIFQKVSK